MELIKEVAETYIERADWFLELVLQHIVLSATAVVLAGVIGLLIGMVISEHDKIASFPRSRSLIKAKRAIRKLPPKVRAVL